MSTTLLQNKEKAFLITRKKAKGVFLKGEKVKAKRLILTFPKSIT